jgi:hypothetical protein
MTLNEIHKSANGARKLMVLLPKIGNGSACLALRERPVDPPIPTAGTIARDQGSGDIGYKYGASKVSPVLLKFDSAARE